MAIFIPVVGGNADDVTPTSGLKVQPIDLSLLDPTNMPIGTTVVSTLGDGWALSVSTATIDHTTVEGVSGCPGLRWIKGGGGGGGGTVTAVNAGTGITVDSSTPAIPIVSAKLATGVAGGQTATGGTAASEALTLQSTTNATKGKINLGAAGHIFVDEAASTVNSDNAVGNGHASFRVVASDTGLGTASANTCSLFSNGNEALRATVQAGDGNPGTQTRAVVGITGDLLLAPTGNNRIAIYGDQLTTLIAVFRKSVGLQLQAIRMEGAKGADVASANNLVLGADGNYFKITGTTQINLIDATNWQAGSTIRLAFTASLTVKTGQTTSGSNTSISLQGAVDFAATAGAILTLTLDGTSWQECARRTP